MATCSVCGEETNLNDAILVGDRYFCKVCQHFPIGTKARMCQLEGCGRLIINPTPARKFHKECSKKQNLILIKKINKEEAKLQKEAWASIPESKKLQLMNDKAMEFLYNESEDKVKIETFKNIKEVV